MSGQYSVGSSGMLPRYDLVIEIGANVGIYSVFFDTLIKSGRPSCQLKQVVSLEAAFEPCRLLDNLRANETVS
jgi:hypothetical protein